MRNKEFGSDFHFITDNKLINHYSLNNLENFVDQFYFSGRVALYEILKFGIEQKGWDKLYVPSYYCHEVYHFIRNLNISIEFFSYNPFDDQNDFQIIDEVQNVILKVNYFGIVSPNFQHLNNASVIDDITHNLSLLETSTADFIFGSLRKVLPIPVGGFVKSKFQLRKLNSNELVDDIAMRKYTAMYLKSEFLKGNLHSKDLFRKFFIDAENNFENRLTVAGMPPSTKSYLDTIAYHDIIEVKKSNLKLLKQKILPNTYFSIFSSENNTDFACILKFTDTEKRNDLRNHLIKSNIFPMVLWPNQIQSNDIIIEQTILFIHVDYRYHKEDINYIAETINEFIKINHV